MKRLFLKNSCSKCSQKTTDGQMLISKVLVVGWMTTTMAQWPMRSLWHKQSTQEEGSEMDGKIDGVQPKLDNILAYLEWQFYTTSTELMIVKWLHDRTVFKRCTNMTKKKLDQYFVKKNWSCLYVYIWCGVYVQWNKCCCATTKIFYSISNFFLFILIFDFPEYLQSQLLWLNEVVLYNVTRFQHSIAYTFKPINKSQRGIFQ